MKILWASDSPTSPSGFGMVTRAVCRGLTARGHRVEILGWQTHGAAKRWEGIPVHPVRHDVLGSDVLLGYMMRMQPNFVITLADVSWMSFVADPAVQRYLDMSGCRWVLYYPIDGADRNGRLPPSWVHMLEAADIPVAMSQFGVDVSRACGVECAYVPHGCDLDIFKPPADKQAAKARLGYQDKFVVLSDARNQPRKLLPRLLDIVAMFCRDKSDVVVHLHTDPHDHAASGVLYDYRLLEDLEMLGLSDQVRFSLGFQMQESAGLSPDELASIYAAADVHLLCSSSEGFGLPNLQAASSGVVPIAVAETASRELVDGHGFAIPAESAMLDEFGLVRYLLSREAAVQALELLYRDRHLLAEHAQRSRQFALDYGWDAILDRWESVLKSAPPRRRPLRSSTFDWIGGDQDSRRSDLPEPVLAAASKAFATLPGGAKVSVQMAERRYGQVAAELYHDAFVEGDQLSLPVRLAPLFEGAPRASIGHLLVSPSDLHLAASIRDIFPSVAISVPKPPDNPTGREFLSLEQLLPALAHYSLVIDYTGNDIPFLDLACASLGVPYAGLSQLWPEIGPLDPLLQVRRLLTDQGLSEWRRQMAAVQADAVYGSQTIATLRSIALAGQPAPGPETTSQRADTASIEMFLVRPRAGAAAEATESIAEHVALHGGLILMATADHSLIVAMPQGGKEVLEAHAMVRLVGGITLDEDRKGARALKKLFLANAAKQLAARQETTSVTARRR